MFSLLWEETIEIGAKNGYILMFVNGTDWCDAPSVDSQAQTPLHATQMQKRERDREKCNSNMADSLLWKKC